MNKGVVSTMNEKYLERASAEEIEFLKQYDPSVFERPSVTADIVILTVNPDGELCVVLIKRGEYPYKGCWALPGGFLQAGKESVTETAFRELLEETGLTGMFLSQLKTYSDPDRDPRTHVISVAHYALVPYEKIKVVAGDDACEAGLFRVLNYNIVGSDYPYQFYSPEKDIMVTVDNMAFDHAIIIKDALKRIYGRRDYCNDLFYLLSNPDSFTVNDYKSFYDAISFTKSDPANFRKMFNNRYVKTGLVKDLGIKSGGSRPAELYKVNF